ncbi:MAG: phage tail protein [Burkholderiales bacterium]|nr:phage tail protein [Burkholderiales bacterium]
MLEVDIASLHAAANVLRSEDVGASVLIKDGQDAADAIELILLEAGLFLSRDPETGLLRVDAVRKGSAMAVPADVQLHPIETTVEHENRPGTRLVYEFQDVGRNFQSSTITLDEDGIADRYAHPTARKIQLGTVIDQDSANKVAERRSQEEFGGASTIKMRMNRNAFLLKPNDLLTLPGIDEVYRVVEVTIKQDTTEVEIALVPDYYGSEPSTNTKPATPNPSVVVAVEADVQATVVEVPAALLDPGEPTQIIVPRVRAHDQVAYADIHLSTDDTTYERVDAEFGVVTGGKLLEALPADAPYVIDEGPTIELLGPPDDDVLDDLSADLANWRLGRQVAVIGGEFFFIQKLTPISGSTYRLDGLMRARYGTPREAHVIGAEVYMFRIDDITPISDSTLTPGASVYVKAQPFAQTGLSLAEVPATNKTIYGYGLRPPAPCGLRVSAPAPGVRAYATGQDVSFKWSSRVANPIITGAGMQGAGTIVGAGVIGATTFEIRVYDATDTLVRTEFRSVNEWTYSNADLAADLGGETDFRVEVREASTAGIFSDEIDLTVEFLS